jgi:secretion/DNA translocation related TadE-like protein
VRPRDGDDTGAATVWAAGAIAVLLVIVGVVWTLGAVVVARHRAAGGADLAALGAAGRAIDGEMAACAHAEESARRMRVRVAECRLDGWDVLVTVQSEVRGPAGLGGTVTAKARAGPVIGTPTTDAVVEKEDTAGSIGGRSSVDADPSARAP